MDLDWKPCERCRRECIPDKAWRDLPRTEREAFKEMGRRRFASGQLCGACYFKARRDHEDVRRRVPDQVVIEEWNWITDPRLPDEVNAENLAPRLGIREQTLLTMVKRLRAEGHIAPESEMAA